MKFPKEKEELFKFQEPELSLGDFSVFFEFSAKWLLELVTHLCHFHMTRTSLFNVRPFSILLTANCIGPEVPFLENLFQDHHLGNQFHTTAQKSEIPVEYWASRTSITGRQDRKPVDVNTNTNTLSCGDFLNYSIRRALQN